MKYFVYLVLVFGLVLPQFTLAQDGEAVASNLANYWARRAKAFRHMKNRQRAALLRRRRSKASARTYIPPWIPYKQPNAEGKKELELEDMQLWASMDLDKDGKLTVSEFERFYQSPNAIAFVRQMKAHRAVQDWASKVGMDVEKAKAAMMVGANAARRQDYAQQQYNVRLQEQRRRAAIARHNQQAYAARQQQQNYWARLGQQYYEAMKRQGGRNEL